MSARRRGSPASPASRRSRSEWAPAPAPPSVRPRGVPRSRAPCRRTTADRSGAVAGQLEAHDEFAPLEVDRVEVVAGSVLMPPIDDTLPGSPVIPSIGDTATVSSFVADVEQFGMSRAIAWRCACASALVAKTRPSRFEYAAPSLASRSPRYTTLAVLVIDRVEVRGDRRLLPRERADIRRAVLVGPVGDRGGLLLARRLGGVVAVVGVVLVEPEVRVRARDLRDPRECADAEAVIGALGRVGGGGHRDRGRLAGSSARSVGSRRRRRPRPTRR